MQAQTWTAGRSSSVVQGALEFAEIGHLFLVFWCAKKSLRAVFQSWAIWWLMGRMHHKVVQFVGHGRLLNLFFGSSQTDVWLPRYGHFKFWGGVVHKIKFTFGLHAVVSNYAQTWCKPKCMVYMEKGSM